MPDVRPEAAPPDLSADGVRLWRQTVRHLKRQQTWEDTDVPLLEAYVRNVLVAREARTQAHGQPFVTGSKGQLVPHPGLRIADQAETAAHKYATALLLTPESRRRHNIQTSEEFAFPQIAGPVEALSGISGRLGS